MRLGPLLALICVFGCKTQPSGPTATPETPQAASDAAPQANDVDGPQTRPTPSEDNADPEQRFCEKLTTLMVASRGANPDPADRQELVETCVTNARRKRAAEPATFDREVECIASASELGAFFDCALDDPSAPQAAGNERFAPLCKKLAKLARDEPDFPEESKRELQNTTRCASDARMEHNAAPQAFEQIESCILKATGMRGASECTAAGAHADPL